MATILCCHTNNLYIIFSDVLLFTCMYMLTICQHVNKYFYDNIIYSSFLMKWMSRAPKVNVLLSTRVPPSWIALPLALLHQQKFDYFKHAFKTCLFKFDEYFDKLDCKWASHSGAILPYLCCILSTAYSSGS